MPALDRPSLAADAERLASRLLPPATVRELSRLSPGVALLQVATEWALILGAAFLTARFFNPVIYVLAVTFIGARQHTLLLHMHEAAHHRLAANRRLNDWIGEIIAWPFLVVRMRAYRSTHIVHHRHLNTMADPDWARKQTPEWAFPMGWRSMLRVLALDLLGLGLVKNVLALKRGRDLGAPRRTGELDEGAMVAARLVFLAILPAALIASGLAVPFLLFWVVPFLTWTQLVLHVRSIAEHFGISGREGPYAGTRTTLASWLDRLFIAPGNAGYHFEHHLYPSVPFHRLPELHRRLMDLPDYRRSLHLTRGYWNVLRECARAGAASQVE